MANVDTDMIIPKQLPESGSNARAWASFCSPRCATTQTAPSDADFVLNRPLIAGRRSSSRCENFGCGSSREHAAWALRDFGFRCVIAPSFADIFFNNCFKNGMLPVALPKAVCLELMGDAERGANATMTVDLEAQELVRSDGERIGFEIEPFRRERLLKGLDEIGATLAQGDKIDEL